MAAREEVIKKVPCVLVEHLTDAQKKAYILTDNRLALDAAEIDDLFSRIHDKNTEDDDFDIDKALEEEAV